MDNLMYCWCREAIQPLVNAAMDRDISLPEIIYMMIKATEASYEIHEAQTEQSKHPEE